MKFSNSLIGILNFLTLIISIPILVFGVWLSKHSYSECDAWLGKFIISLGVFLLVVSLMGFIGACCRVSSILCFYLIVILLLIILLFSFAIFAFVVTNKGAGETLPNKGHKEYRLGSYSNWLQNRVNNNNNWNTIKSFFNLNIFALIFITNLQMTTLINSTLSICPLFRLDIFFELMFLLFFFYKLMFLVLIAYKYKNLPA
jgi:hypothetical protein